MSENSSNPKRLEYELLLKKERAGRSLLRYEVRAKLLYKRCLESGVDPARNLQQKIFRGKITSSPIIMVYEWEVDLALKRQREHLAYISDIPKRRKAARTQKLQSPSYQMNKLLERLREKEFMEKELESTREAARKQQEQREAAQLTSRGTVYKKPERFGPDLTLLKKKRAKKKRLLKQDLTHEQVMVLSNQRPRGHNAK